MNIDRNHVYREGGRVIPSVTQILKDLNVFDYSFLNPKYAERGSAIHELTELIDQHMIIPVNSEYCNYLSAYERFLTDSNIRIIRSEYMIHYKVDGLEYAGTLDRVLEINGTPWIIDIKTGAAQPWHGYQLAAYGLAYDETIRRAVLELRRNGTYKLVQSKNSRNFSDNYWIIEWKQLLRRYYERNNH